MFCLLPELAADAADHLVGRLGERARSPLGQQDLLGQSSDALTLSRAAGRRGSW